MYKKNYAVRIELLKHIQTKNNRKITKSNWSEKQLASLLWYKLKNPKVKLNNAETKIYFFFYNNKVYCTKELGIIDDKFHDRRAHLRPIHHSGSLHPKVARALVNLLGITKKDVLLDPFCGTGGFLIEGGRMGIEVKGYDINWKMVYGCSKNLDAYKVNKYDIMKKDALEMNEKIKYIITDFPYGLNSTIVAQDKSLISLKGSREGTIKSIELFYLDFLKKVKRLLQKKAVIIFPSFVEYKKLLRKSKLKKEKEFTIYIHKSLSRKIVLLKP